MQNASPEPFNFFNFLTANDHFLEIVSQVRSKVVHGTPMFLLYKKLKLLKVELKVFNQTRFGGISVRLEVAKAQLDSVQLSLLNNPGCSELCKLDKVQRKLFICTNMLVVQGSFSQAEITGLLAEVG